MNAQTGNSKPLPTTSVVTGVGRGSYVAVFEPKLNDLSGNVEYSMAFLIPKDDAEGVARLRQAAKAAVDAKWPDPNRRPPNLRNPLRDGDVEKPGDEAYADHYWINVKSKNPPGIVDAQLQKVIDPRAFVSGDYCRISVNAYTYDRKGNRGVAFGLNNVQVVGKGEPLSGAGRRAEDEFSVYGDAGGAESAADSDRRDDDIPF